MKQLTKINVKMRVATEAEEANICLHDKRH